MNSHRKIEYTGPVAQPVTDTYLAAPSSSTTKSGTPPKMYPLELDWNQKEVLWTVLETEISRLRAVLDRSTDWDDRTNAAFEIPLLENIIAQLRGE